MYVYLKNFPETRRRLRFHREKSGKTMREAAAYLEYKDENWILKMETSIVRYKLRDLLKLAKLYGCEVEDLIGGKLPEGAPRLFTVHISEMNGRNIIVEAEDKYKAEEIAEELCNSGTVDLDGNDFCDRNIECFGESDAHDIINCKIFDGSLCGPVRAEKETGRIGIERAKQLLANCIRYISYDNDSTAEHLTEICGFTKDELVELGCGYFVGEE